MIKKSKSMMLLFLTAPVLGSCGLIPLPPVSIGNVEISTPIALQANAMADRLFKTESFLDTEVPKSFKKARIAGEATLNAPASERLVINVLMSEELPTGCISDLVPIDTGYKLCNEGGINVGTLAFEKGETTTSFNLSGSTLTNIAHAGKGYIGLQMVEGSVVAGTALKLTNMQARANY